MAWVPPAVIGKGGEGGLKSHLGGSLPQRGTSDQIPLNPSGWPGRDPARTETLKNCTVTRLLGSPVHEVADSCWRFGLTGGFVEQLPWEYRLQISRMLPINSKLLRHTFVTKPPPKSIPRRNGNILARAGAQMRFQNYSQPLGKPKACSWVI